MGCCGSAQRLEVANSQSQWADLEEPLREGWVKLVRASWLVELAENGGVLSRRQDLPEDAFVSLRELKAAGGFWLTLTNDLRIIVLSYPWLQPGHPDPHGQNLRVIAKALKFFVDFQYGSQLFGVLIDFTALFQVDPITLERTEEEKEIFKKALPELNVFYSHPHTYVLKVTKFPAGYPHDPLFPYALPDGANTNEYMKRGWCFAESSISGLVKASDKVLDLGKFRDDCPSMLSMLDSCRAGRAPPMHPEDFKAELDNKAFTSKRDDFARVEGLYSKAFGRLLENAETLNYSSLSWGPDEARQLFRALRDNSTLETLNLTGNRIGDEGAAILGEALRTNSSLRNLFLSDNSIGSAGAHALAEAIRVNTTLECLDLWANNLGGDGKAALQQADSRRVVKLTMW